MYRVMGCLLAVALFLSGCSGIQDIKIVHDFNQEMRKQRARRGECQFVNVGRREMEVVCPEDPDWEEKTGEAARARRIERQSEVILNNSYYRQIMLDQRLAGMSTLARERFVYEEYLRGYRAAKNRKYVPGTYTLVEPLFCFEDRQNPFNYKGWVCAPVRGGWGEP